MGVTFTRGPLLMRAGEPVQPRGAITRSDVRDGRRPSRVDPDGAAVVWFVLTVAVFFRFFDVAEVQQASNCFAPSKNNDLGFGVAALLDPIWQIVDRCGHLVGM
ncbi:hypothetical protein AURDEDRAFT_160394 [Auricularia subglabra TFB-10046 SS5]|nr:hypothetical protein AURDEDRAFT_160394 [Auricularia subglabra TFB-10046 SS5]